MLLQHEELACRLTSLFAALPQVQAIGLGGSLRAALNDAASDIDLYVLTRWGAVQSAVG